MAEASLVFMSHGAEDKEFVESVARHLPQSHLFIDVRTIDPGTSFRDAMDNGVEEAVVFCLFASPTSVKKRWVNYEIDLAKLKRLRRNTLEVLVVPIKGASHKDAPKWMQNYMAVPASFTPFDIARTIRGLQESALKARGDIASEEFRGREEGLAKQLLRLRSEQAKSGVFINTIVISGFQRMGRRLFASHLTKSLYPSGRSFGPTIDLPPFADALDLYFGLRETRLDPSDFLKFKRDFKSFAELSDSQQAVAIVEELDHYGSINQQVLVRSSFGLRDRVRNLKRWTAELFDLLRTRPNTRLIWLSERLLPEDVLIPHPNVVQIGLTEISATAAADLLMALVPERDLSPLIVEDLCKRTGGHPGTIHFLASLLRGGKRSPESLLHDLDEVRSFQDQLLKAVLESITQDVVSIEALHALSIFPALSFAELAETLKSTPAVLAPKLHDLADSGLILETGNSIYSVPEIVRSSFRRRFGEAPSTLLSAASNVFQREFDAGTVSKSTVDKLLFAKVLATGKLPEELAEVVSPATLQQLVHAEYDKAFGLRGTEAKAAYARAATLSELADVIPMPEDACEDILFVGGEALVRSGQHPERIVKMMQKRAFPSANFLLGYYEFDRNRDAEAAIPFLRRAFDLGVFRRRVSRMLARVYLDANKPALALDVIEKMGEETVRRDSGLLSQKYRAYLSLGRRAEATKLLPALRALHDAYGEYELIEANRLYREKDIAGAFAALTRAEERPRANKHNIRFLRCIWQLDLGDISGLDEASKHANGVGRTDEALHLRSRAALGQGDTVEADLQWRKIEKPNFLDIQLRARIISALLQNPRITSASKLDLEAELDSIGARSRRMTTTG